MHTLNSSSLDLGCCTTSWYPCGPCPFWKLPGTLWWHLIGRGRSPSACMQQPAARRPHIVTTISYTSRIFISRVEEIYQEYWCVDHQHVLAVPENRLVTCCQKISKYLWHRRIQELMNLNSQRYFFSIVCIPIQWWIRIGTNVINLSIADHLTTSSVKHPAFQQPSESSKYKKKRMSLKLCPHILFVQHLSTQILTASFRVEVHCSWWRDPSKTPARRLWSKMKTSNLAGDNLPFVRSKSGRLEHCGVVGLMTIRTKKYEREEMSEKLSFRLWTNAAFRGHQVVNTVRSILNNDHWMMEVMQTICSCFKHVWQQIACHYVEWYCPVEKVNYSFSTQNYPFWNYFLQKPRPAARRRLLDSGGGSYGEHPRRIPRCGQRRWQCP